MSVTPTPQPAARAGWGAYLPKLVTCMREGYSPAALGRDALAIALLAGIESLLSAVIADGQASVTAPTPS